MTRRPDDELEEVITVGHDGPPPKKRQRHGHDDDDHMDMDNEGSPDPLAESPELDKKSSHSSRKETSRRQQTPPKQKINDEAAFHPSDETLQRIKKLIDNHGTIPTEALNIHKPLAPEASTLLALLFHSMLSSTRISHKIAYRTTQLLLENNYHDLATLSRSTWDERTRVLTEGGYTHYREKTATHLGDLAEHLQHDLNSDLRCIINKEDKTKTTKHDHEPSTATVDISEIRKSLKSIKGLGDVGIDIFLNSVQAYWPSIAPFIDPRSLSSLEKMGITISSNTNTNISTNSKENNSEANGDRNDDVDTNEGDSGSSSSSNSSSINSPEKKEKEVQMLWEAVGRDSVRMARLANAVTVVRLEKREGEFM